MADVENVIGSGNEDFVTGDALANALSGLAGSPVSSTLVPRVGLVRIR